jgi:hypothetical protein
MNFYTIFIGALLHSITFFCLKSICGPIHDYALDLNLS